MKTPAVLLAVFALILTYCNREIGDEVKVPDFRTLESCFKEPPAEYTSAPFFVWNAEMTREEIDNFLTGFRQQGSLQVFIHPRPGLITEYISDKWFEMFRYAVDKGKELGMKVWIYDENSYPSGFAGGHVPAQMPESYNQGQGLKMIKAQTLPDTAESYFIVLKEEVGSFRDITGSLAAEKGRNGNYLLFLKTYHGKSDWYGGFPYVDLLHKGVTQKFLELTMSGYEKHISDEFGKTVPGTFTDEPQISSPGGIRYTPDIFNEFRERWGYDLLTSLPSLFEETGDWKKVRHNYTQTLLDMFIERWAKPWYEYCEKKGLIFTGHYWEHEWPNMRMGGDNMAMYIYHQMPGIDMLFNQFNDSTPNAQFGNIRAVKELSSAANQSGRSRTLSETYGGSGWDITFTELKRNGDWEYALGVNLMNQHLTYFTMAGARKYDYPPSFDYHQPWWNDYKYINDHYARLSLALSAGRQKNDILVLEPSTTSWMYDSYVKRNPETGKIGQSFQSFITILEKNQVEYDLGSESIIKAIGSSSNGKLRIGNAAYSTVVIPPNTENLNSETFILLKKFAAGGGRLILFSSPSMRNGSPDEKLKEYFEKGSPNLLKQEELTVTFISDNLKNENTEFSDLAGGQVYHHTRTLTDGSLLFICNSSLTESAEGKIRARGADVIEMNTLSGDIAGYSHQKQGPDVILSYSLHPAGSLLLFIPNKNPDVYQVPGPQPELIPLNSGTPVTVSRNSDNALTIDFCDITIDGKTSADLHVFTACDMVYKYFGFSNGNPWNHSVQYRKNIIDRDTFGINTGFTATYHFNIREAFDFSTFKAVVERPWLWTVSLNGQEIKAREGEWWLDRQFGVFSIGSLVRAGRNVLTVKASPMKIHAEVEPVYILGNFSVYPAEKGWEIAPPPVKYSTGSWLEQGMPFYSWDVSYYTDFTVDKPEGRYYIQLKDWKGTISKVLVNGKQSALIAFPPFRAEITGNISEGKNTIEVKVTGSLRNLQGPHHNNPPVGLASPWNWRNVRRYPTGKEYRLYDYGLIDEIILLNAR